MPKSKKPVAKQVKKPKREPKAKVEALSQPIVKKTRKTKAKQALPPAETRPALPATLEKPALPPTIVLKPEKARQEATVKFPKTTAKRRPAQVPPAPIVAARSPIPPTPMEKRPEPAPAAPPPQAPAPQKPKVKFNETITIKELAEKMGIKTPDVIKKLMGLGTLASINQRLEPDKVELLAEAFGFEAEMVPIFSEEGDQEADDPSALLPRPPVVTVMGHVNHGKTSLLDAIRSTKVAAKEAGGITQHMGAYQVRTPRGIITFLDTPGHEAFTAMRARGAVATDLVILVVAADDGVMPQTIEAIDHAKAANVPIVVAINKIDLPTANSQKIKQALSDYNLLPEEWGGKTIMVEVSARTQQNLDKLLEMVLLEAELLELKANPNRPAKGTVLEAHRESGRGSVATVLIKTGTLKIGDVFVCGFTSGKVKALMNHRGERLDSAGPSTPVELLGFSELPQAGDLLVAVSNEREAREIAARRKDLAHEAAQKPRRRLSLEHLHEEMKEGKVKELPLILKADVQGSLQALKDSLERLSTPNILLKMVHAGIGNINSSDVLLAEASDAVVIGFNVKAETRAEEEARRTGVEIRTYRIIYEVLAEVRAAMEGLLEPELKEVFMGRAQVKQSFKIPKSGTAAGCLVSDGKLVRGAKARVIRAGKIVFEGTISSLKRFKDDVRDVDKGFECGMTIEGCQNFQPGDLIEAFQIEKRAKKLEET